jgi:hypothetical protein
MNDFSTLTIEEWLIKIYSSEKISFFFLCLDFFNYFQIFSFNDIFNSRVTDSCVIIPKKNLFFNSEIISNIQYKIYMIIFPQMNEVLWFFCQQ